MALTDVTRPVIINTSLLQRVQIENWIRKVCFVSVGQSLLAAGTSQKVTKSNYKNFISKSEELTSRLNAFFSYSGDTKSAYILETGPQEGEPLSDDYTNLYKYAKEQEEFKDLNYQKYLYNNIFAYPKQFEKGVETSTMLWVNWESVEMTTGAEVTLNIATNAADVTLSTQDAGITLEKQTLGAATGSVKITGKTAGVSTVTLTATKDQSTEVTIEVDIKQVDNFGTASYGDEKRVYAQYQNTYYETKAMLIQWYNYAYNGQWNEGQYTVFYTNNKLNDDASSVKLYFDTILYQWKDDYISYLANNSQDFQSLEIKSNLEKYLATQNWYNSEAYGQWLVDNGTFNTDYSAKIDTIKAFINECKERFYIYVLPKQLCDYANIRNHLISTYAGLNDALYFFTDYKYEEAKKLANKNEILAENVGNKSEFCVIDNIENKNPILSAIIAGIFASNKFDFSIDNPASPFNFKFITGVNLEELSRDTKLQLINASVNFADNIANQNVIMNGRCKDTYPLDYWYQWDYLAFQIDNDIKNLLLTGVNNPKYVIRYNQNGIDTLKARVLATLQNAMNLGLITEFCESVDPTDGSLINKDTILAISYADYVASNPEDYQNEIYGGISFFVRIGRYIRQVVINVTLG